MKALDRMDSEFGLVAGSHTLRPGIAEQSIRQQPEVMRVLGRQGQSHALAAIAQAILAAKRLEEIIYEEVEFQIRLVRTYRDKIPLTQQYTAYEEEALKAEKQKMAAGKSTSFNVLLIASGLASAQVNEVTTLRDYNKALSELAFRKGSTLERWRIDPPARSNR